jgi:predicted permease
LTGKNFILKYKLRQAYNTLTRSPRQKKLGWLISIAFIVPYYTMLTRTMRLIYSGLHRSSGWQSVALLANVNLAMIFFFVLVSTCALTLYRMFRAKDLPLLMSLPVQDKSLFLAKLAESLTDAGRSMILPFPVCLAFVSVVSGIISPFAATIFLVGWAGVMLQLASFSIIAALALGRIIAASRWAALLKVVAVVAAIAFLLIFMSYVHIADFGISSAALQGTTPLAKFAPLSTFFPTSWLVKSLPQTDSAIWIRLLYGLAFAAATAGCPILAFQLFKGKFRHVWMMSTEVKRRRPLVSAPDRSGQARKPVHIRGSVRAVMLKEARVMQREPHTWIGLTIPLVLFPVFIFFRAQGVGTQAVYVIVVSLLTAASYSLSCMGREGRSFSLLRSLPMRMWVVLRAKLFLGCAVNLVVTLTFAIALYLTRRSSLSQMWQNVLIAAIASVYLSAFGTALAALFPKFDFTNPMRAASLPGILSLYLIALLFGVTFIGIISAGWYLAPLVLVPWAGIALMLMKAGQERLEKMDI